MSVAIQMEIEVTSKLLPIFISLILIIFNYAKAESQPDIGYSLEINYQTYNVIGETETEINTSFNNKIKFIENTDIDAYTQWNYNIINDDTTCEINKFSVNVTYILPQIIISDSNKKAASLFKSYLERLYRHEETHCAISVKLLHDIYIAIEKGQSSNCNDQREIADRLEQDISKSQEAFDMYTNHGEIELANSPFGEEKYLAYCKISLPVFKNN